MMMVMENKKLAEQLVYIKREYSVWWVGGGGKVEAAQEWVLLLKSILQIDDMLNTTSIFKCGQMTYLGRGETALDGWMDGWNGLVWKPK